MSHRLQLTLVRHGETEWSRTGQHTGRTDLPLNDRGRQQALDLRKHLEERYFDAVFSSPLKRAAETATLAGMGKSVKYCPGLVEWDYGAFEGRTTSELASERGGHFSIWDTEIPNGESLEAVGKRADQVLRRLLERGGSILLFSHGHFLRILAARWLEQPPHHGRRLILNAAAFSCLGYEHDTPVIVTWNQCT